ncbi:glycosyltransferase family 1 protein [Anaerorudis cellulosivorans]|jgi:glycosyltransferase involved in cell wall biosynthesis|uniref:glycosyltransferase family 1 protein n=1 Tax=Anaerorudis cellulosivorans TaxID=3397862 RepID=UPI00221EDFD8|nr:glycosyltransferase family 1 protein [Seramator thermalis]MCW1734240.1 glycosyltransferase family 1 protein [Seramator thermalis]
MKVLLVYSNKNQNIDNPYVFTLKKELENIGCKVDWGLDLFWNNFEEYNIIHFQWPEAIFEWQRISEKELSMLINQINLIKERKITIIYTRHNIKPHYCNNPFTIKLYEIIEENCDVVFHMGYFSKKQFEENVRNDKVLHYIIPHHTYDALYETNISQIDSRKVLKIPQNKFVFLCFGSFRNNEERKMVLDGFKKLKLPNKYLFAPRFYQFKLSVNHPRSLIKGIKERCNVQHYTANSRLKAGFIGNEALPFYFSAADIIFIQRCQILNSGNIPLAFLFGKVVIGPDIGNVGEILRNTGNPYFNPKNNSSVVSAMSEGIEKAKAHWGAQNKEYATKNLNSHKIAIEIKSIYESVL